MEITNVNWLLLSNKQKEDVIDYCNNHLGKDKPDAFCETGEPMYFDDNGNLLEIHEVIDGIYNMVK